MVVGLWLVSWFPVGYFGGGLCSCWFSCGLVVFWVLLLVCLVRVDWLDWLFWISEFCGLVRWVWS